MRIRGLEDDDIKKGYMISNYQEPCQVCSEFEARLQVLELPEHKPIMSEGYTCVLHLHTSVEEVEITTVVSLYDNEKKKYIKSSFLRSGVTGQARILVSKSLEGSVNNNKLNYYY
jgi:peptide chain release factor subunit 3